MGQRAPYDSYDQEYEWFKLRERIKHLTESEDSSLDMMTEVSPKFIGLMMGALLVSRHKYGRLAEGYPEKVNAIGKPENIDPAIFDQLGSFGKRLKWYFFGQRNPDYGEPGEPEYLIEPGNAEYLVDAANMLQIEWMHPAHPNAHYTPTDRSGSPGRVAQNALYDRANQYTNAELLDVNEVSTF